MEFEYCDITLCINRAAVEIDEGNTFRVFSLCSVCYEAYMRAKLITAAKKQNRNEPERRDGD